MSDDLQLDDEQLRRALEKALAPFMEPIRFDFHSQTLAEDNKTLVVMFEGSDGHSYCLTVNTAEGWSTAQMRRVD